MRSISLVFPVYNEEGYVFATLEKALQVLPDITDDFEIIIVNDASTDGTVSLLQDFSRNKNKIKVFHNDRNRGLGGTLKRGFQEATKEFVLYSDFDMPFELKKVPGAIKILEQENADLLSAYRINREADGLKRTIYSVAYNRLVNSLFHLNIKDINFAFKLFRRSILDGLNLESEGSFISAEFLIRAKLKDFKTVQFPATYYPRAKGHSHLSSIRVIAKIIKELFIFYFNYFIPHLERKRKIGDRIAGYYKDAGLLNKLYINLRLRSCPFWAIEQYIPPQGKITDLGCGLGIFSAWLYEKSSAREITAIDWNQERINCARRLLGDRINFLCANITDVPLDASDCIFLIDTLYLFSDNKQKKLLSRLHLALKKKGVLLILEKDTRPWLKYLWCSLQEFFITKCANLNLSRSLNLKNKQEMKKLIEGAGFSVASKYLGKGYFYPHILYICTNAEKKSFAVSSPSR